MKDVRDLVAMALTSYRCQYTCDADGDALPLVDALTPPFAESIVDGKRELELLAEHISMNLEEEGKVQEHE